MGSRGKRGPSAYWTKRKRPELCRLRIRSGWRSGPRRLFVAKEGVEREGLSHPGEMAQCQLRRAKH
eukprot:3424196-Alexandrium_andersonii.AAC.1